jgi:alkanesulfonate monooxygenase SsuD/methylene tetrahydromethanopterin reductase-like flavin-dependent oxidoreductase (luciferase family)
MLRSDHFYKRKYWRGPAADAQDHMVFEDKDNATRTVSHHIPVITGAGSGDEHK